VSEYQYYEFVAVDRPLSERQLAELRELSTRAEITPTSFVNTYHWGDFRGDPRKLPPPDRKLGAYRVAIATR
jgi:hypothetical protein